ncbi:hypothetical protein B0A49_02004 [Cryomyces minteri]|uniref:Uncharacterized protein n=1 Tax=Cryomyces minteri TaxID=331657 RepID=A0A4U0Y0W7_9PEZI|nr:hypothetical protein B0A49_02004 [Cryomyces minteri]
MSAGITIGSGLVEIAALTALIGSSTAESLVLGDRGAAGLCWAAMSAFGSVHLVKACVAASTPSWLRDTMGVRNARSDAAIGHSLNLVRKMRGTKSIGEAIGISAQYEKSSIVRKEGAQDESGPQVHITEDIYALEPATAEALRACPTLKKDTALQSFVYVRDPDWRREDRRRSLRNKDLLAMAASVSKLAEVYTLWRYGAGTLSFVTAVNWAYFLLSASILQISGVSREHEEDSLESSYIDILSGKLPTAQIAGEDGKILLGVPLNPRKSLAWRLVWSIGSVVCSSSMVATYMFMSRQQPISLYIWAAFQLLWLICRSVFFYFAEETADMKHAITAVGNANSKPPHVTTRLQNLTYALSKYQMLAHPRGPWCYAQDIQSTSSIKSVFEATDKKLHKSVDQQVEAEQGVEVSILAVIGDTLLSSAAWMRGYPLTGMDLYDSCIVCLKVAGETKLIPSARVLSGPPKEVAPKDVEIGVAPAFVAIGGTNDGTNISWVYWIPYEGNRWLHFRTEDGVQVLGQRTARVVNNIQVTNQLMVGDLYISLQSVVDVEDIVKKSTAAGLALCDLMPPVSKV